MICRLIGLLRGEVASVIGMLRHHPPASWDDLMWQEDALASARTVSPTATTIWE